MASRISTKSARWATRSSSRAASSSAGVDGQDHPAHDREPVLGEEHVLGPAQADALGPEPAGVGGVGTVVGVGPHPEMARPGSRRPSRGWSRTRAAARPRTAAPAPSTTVAVGAVDGDPVALGHHGVPDRERAGRRCGRSSAPTTAGLPQPAGHHGGVADQAAPGGEDALGGQHAVDVLGRGLAADQDHLLAPLGRGRGVVGGEVDPAHRRPRRGAQAPGEHRVPGPGELRVEDLVEVLAGDPLHAPPAWSAGWPAPRPCPRPSCSAARPVRLPTRVWSIQSLPCSMVNSVSHMSR